MSYVQQAGEHLAQQHGFLGVPTTSFDKAGRQQFIALLSEGVSPESRVCEIGCGVLRVGYWLIQLLEPGNYCGIEPHTDRISWGKNSVLPHGISETKNPRFDHNADFDTSVFNEKFDFFLAGSIWTHCSKNHIRTMLDGFLANSVHDGVFLVSVLLAADASEDYQGDTWVGTSHESDTSGIVRHSFAWIREECRSRQLSVDRLPGSAFDGQIWLRIKRAKAPYRPENLRDR